jgi:mono/diheme cytochrome c family protein
VACVTVGSGLLAQSVKDGVYSAEQAQRGAGIFSKQCASCHGEDLLGNGPMPALMGEEFVKGWKGQSVGDLFERTRVSMPADHPGSLTKEQTADVIAFVLKSNGFPVGKAELKGDVESLNKIKF